jgi:enoyl-CoA hydratase/carnithine racemase
VGDHVIPDFSQISLEVADRVLVLRLNRPERMNAFTPVMRTEIVEALDWAEATQDVRVVIVTGEGRAFCAGADLGGAGDKPFSYSGDGMRNESSDADSISGLPRDGGGVVSLRLASFPKPVIAAINGAAIGVGITMTLPMDIRIASSKAKFGFVFARRGIAPEAVSSWFLPRVVGISQATEWALTGRVFGADEALRGGLVSRVVEPEDVLSTAQEIAREIADNTSGVSVAVTRRMLWSQLSVDDLWETHRLETELIAELKQGPDAKEGVTSFLEKRDAVFTGTLDTDLPAALPEWPIRPAAD